MIAGDRHAGQDRGHRRLPIVIVGQVDHGKSTLIGRLLHDAGQLHEGRLEALRKASETRGMPFEWAFLTDALQAERNQNVTIEASHIPFRAAGRDFMLIDAPGHREFLRNLISGGADADAALFLTDAGASGEAEPLPHAELLHLLGIRQLGVAVSKMDAAGYEEAAFRQIEKRCHDRLAELGLTPAFVIPLSAREGENIHAASAAMPWHQGPTLLEALALFKPRADGSALPLRFAVQDVYRREDRRILVGRVESGRLAVGEELLFSPGGGKARVAGIEAWGANPPSLAQAGEAVGITLTEPVFIERGHIGSHVTNAPHLSSRFRARLFWLGTAPLRTGAVLKLRHLTSEWPATILSLEGREELGHGEMAGAALRLRGLAALDAFSTLPRSGRFALLEDSVPCGGGIILAEGLKEAREQPGEVKSAHIAPLDLEITPAQRAAVNGHRGGILWLTGLPGSGKSTLAVALQRQLFARGCQAYVLDGDNLRSGLNRDLGFSASDRSENIRRAAEVAALFAAAGVIVIASFISPAERDREQARAAAPGVFHLVHVKAGLAACERRDPKGLYGKARRGEISDFTGVSAPYEEPADAELVIDTEALSAQESVSLLAAYAAQQFIATVGDAL